MDECAEKAEVILGDGRLSLNSVKDGHFDLLVMDAFASDSVPVHLITLEALDLYISKISPEGVVLFNISNRYMDFSKVLTTLANTRGFDARINSHYFPESESFSSSYKENSTWFVIARTSEALEFLDNDSTTWETVPQNFKDTLWTDDYSNIIGVMKWLLW